MTEIPYIGHVLAEQCVKVDPSKQQAVATMTSPKTVDELRRFLEFVNYRVLPGLATAAEPTRRLLVKDVSFEWTAEQESSFLRTKEKSVHVAH